MPQIIKPYSFYRFTRSFHLLADVTYQFAGKSEPFIDLIMTYGPVFHYFA